MSLDCKNIIININSDGSITVKDDGRGIPIDYHKGEKKSAAEVITVSYTHLTLPTNREV